MRSSVLRIFNLGGATTGQLLMLNKNRAGILFLPCATAGQSYSVFTSQVAAITDGINMTNTSAPLQLTRETHGDVVQQPWYVVTSATNVGVPILETTET